MASGDGISAIGDVSPVSSDGSLAEDGERAFEEAVQGAIASVRGFLLEDADGLRLSPEWRAAAPGVSKTKAMERAPETEEEDRLAWDAMREAFEGRMRDCSARDERLARSAMRDAREAREAREARQARDAHEAREAREARAFDERNCRAGDVGAEDCEQALGGPDGRPMVTLSGLDGGRPGGAAEAGAGSAESSESFESWFFCPAPPTPPHELAAEASRRAERRFDSHGYCGAPLSTDWAGWAGWASTFGMGGYARPTAPPPAVN